MGEGEERTSSMAIVKSRRCVNARLPDHVDKQSASQKKEWEVMVFVS